jgi:hypothetical protein
MHQKKLTNSTMQKLRNDHGRSRISTVVDRTLSFPAKYRIVETNEIYNVEMRNVEFFFDATK